ncbi:MAG: hypothetical protein C4558_10230 [Dehalococcoidia bacterium]|nr:MAG: hypothetical protein C4558_10230 [Dehalococcoidia bacterium]
MRDLIVTAARLPLWVRWGVVFFVIFMTASAFRGNLAERPLYTTGVCVLVSIAFGALAQVEQKLPGSRQKRTKRE